MELSSKRNIETIEKTGKSKFRGKTTAKTMRGWITGYISKSVKNGNVEADFFFREVLNAYNYFHPEKKGYVATEEWKGESSFQVIKDLDSLTISNNIFSRKGNSAEQ